MRHTRHLIKKDQPEYYFTGTLKGDLSQFPLDESEPPHVYTNAHSNKIYSICVTNDNEFVFSADQGGNLKQHSNKTRK